MSICNGLVFKFCLIDSVYVSLLLNFLISSTKVVKGTFFSTFCSGILSSVAVTFYSAICTYSLVFIFLFITFKNLIIAAYVVDKTFVDGLVLIDSFSWAISLSKDEKSFVSQSEAFYSSFAPIEEVIFVI